MKHRKKASSDEERTARGEASPSTKGTSSDAGDISLAAENSSVAMVQETAQQKKNLAADIFLLALKIILVVLFLIFLFTFLFGIEQVKDNTMDPAIKEGDLVIYYRLTREYNSGDAVVADIEGQDQIRRIVAHEGDTVDITDQGLTINGYVQQEEEAVGETLPYKDGITLPVELTDGQVFLLADRRENATDSRIYGPVDEKALRGAIITVIRRRNI